MTTRHIAGSRRPYPKTQIGEPKKGGVDIIAVIALIPVVMGIVLVATFSWGRPSVMALVLDNISILTIVGTSVVQYTPVVIVYFLAAISMFSPSWIWIKSSTKGRLWLWPALIALFWLILLTTSWFYLAFALCVALFSWTVKAIFLGIGWVWFVLPGRIYLSFLKARVKILGFLLFLIKRGQQKGANPPFAYRVPADAAWWVYERTWGRNSGNGSPPSMSRGPSKALEKSLDTAEENIKRDFGNTTRGPVIFVAVMAALQLVLLPGQLVPMERVEHEDESVIAGYVIRADETWTVIVTKERVIQIDKTADIVSRSSCPDIHVALPYLISEHDSVWDRVRRVPERWLADYYGQPDTCSFL